MSPKRKSDNQSPRRTRADGNTRWDAPHQSMAYGPDKPSTRTNSSRERVSYFWPDISKQLEKFTFFWRADSPFSQHHPAKFFLDGSMFNCSEQYYMYQKAVTFHDDLCARKIMGTSDPAKQKSLAKGIQYFDQEIWDNISYDVVKRANIAKFGSNERLLNLLVATRGTELVEASPKDHKWGIGLEADRPEALRRITWRGENKLGKILTEIRDTEFKGVEYKPEKLLHGKLYGYLYFWRSSSPFSPKHLAPFKVGDLSFVSLFHFLMFKSAELSGNKRSVDKITREMKHYVIEKVAYENQIDEHAWKLSMIGNLIEGNFYKFGDNPNLKALLLATNGKMLVFQSRFEGIGNGLEEEDSRDLVTSSDWRGTTNLLGSILTFMRDEWIKKPNTTLDEFKSKELPSYNLDAIDLMHMRRVEPPLLKECVDQPQCSTAKPEDAKKEETRKMEDSMWNHDSNKTATKTKTDGDANDSKKKKLKDDKKAAEKLEHKSEDANCNKSETCKKSEADDKFKELLPSSFKDKKIQESQDMEIDLSGDDDDDDKTGKCNEKSKKTKTQKERKDTKKEENQKMEDSMQVYDSRLQDSNKNAGTKTDGDANDSKKKKDNKKAAEKLEHKSEEANCNKSETCKKSQADDKFKKLLPNSSKDKKMQESQDVEIDLSGDDDDDEKTGEPEEKPKKSISQKKREKYRRRKERRK